MPPARSDARGSAHPLLVRLVDRVKGVLDGDALQVARRHLHAEREVQVDLLDGRRRQELLEDFLLLDACRGAVDLPVPRATRVSQSVSLPPST
jgi:hypothetical protein